MFQTSDSHSKKEKNRISLFFILSQIAPRTGQSLGQSPFKLFEFCGIIYSVAIYLLLVYQNFCTNSERMIVPLFVWPTVMIINNLKKSENNCA